MFKNSKHLSEFSLFYLKKLDAIEVIAWKSAEKYTKYNMVCHDWMENFMCTIFF
jgi:hypothetical protein